VAAATLPARKSPNSSSNAGFGRSRTTSIVDTGPPTAIATANAVIR
jgi:hypothetical protein